MSDWTGRLMRVVRAVMPLLIVAAGVGGLLVFGRPQGVAKQEAAPSRAALVSAESPRPFTGEIVLKRDGVAVPFRRVEVAAEVAGRVVEKARQARAGRFVQAGELLFRLDPTDYELRVRELEARLRQAEEDIRAVDVDLENTEQLLALAQQQWELEKRQLARAERLATQNAISESALEEARRAELTARNGYQTLVNQRASLLQRRRTLGAARELIVAQLEEARVDLSRTEVRSPLAGTVVKDFVEQGDFVKLGDPLVEISEAGKKEIRCSLSLTDLMWIWMAAGIGPSGQIPPQRRFEVPSVPVEVVLTLNGREYVWAGVLSRYDGSGLDVDTRLVPCRVLVDRPEPVAIRDADGAIQRRHGRAAEEGLRPSADKDASERVPGPPTLFSGAYVKLRIRIRPAVALWEIPEAALKPGNELWVVRSGHLKILAAPVARIEGKRVLLWGSRVDLREGDLLVTSPLPAAFDGLPVRVMSGSDGGSDPAAATSGKAEGNAG